MTYPLHIALIWHMHQPDYLDPRTGEFALPWVRLHAAKDYLRMAELLARHPEMHATVNFVPALVAQIRAYAEGTGTDRALAVSEKTRWTKREKEFILDFFFSINEARILRRSARYQELKARRDASDRDPRAFRDADYLDIIASFNLAWMDSETLDKDRAFRALAKKGAGYTARDAAAILAKQRELLRKVVPTYKALAKRGQVELTCSPYYHPILPLLVDTELAEVAEPHLPVPHPPFVAPEDAREQLSRAVRAHAAHFGKTPVGLWPSEGAVGQEVVPLIADGGFRWFGSDEAVLARSLEVRIERNFNGDLANPALLCQPYWVQSGNRRVAAIFRDHVLSDRIGFVYQAMGPEEAADDFVRRLHRIYERVEDDGLPYLVAVILDGENAWEFYDQNGNAFLDGLYQRLSDDLQLKPVTVSEYLEQYPPRASIKRLFTGSWINGNLDTWIGERKHNEAWESLRLARQRLLDWEEEHPDAPKDMTSKAWEEIYRAEGSDWFWWYSSRNNAVEKRLFDALFRARLQEVYRLLGEAVPSQLVAATSPELQPARVIPFVPVGRGHLDPSFWKQTLTLTPTGVSAGPTQRASTPVRHVHLYRDRARLYLRVETYEPLGRRGLLAEIWPAASTANAPLRLRVFPNGSGAEPTQIAAEHGADWISVSVPLATVSSGAQEVIALRVGLVGENGEDHWVLDEWPAELMLETPEG